MRKILIGSIYAFLFLWLSCIVTVILRNIFFSIEKTKALIFVIVAIIIIIVVGITYYLLSKIVKCKFVLRVVCFLINSVSLGIAMTGWYIDRGYTNPLWMMTVICLCAVCYLFTMYSILQIPFIRNNMPRLAVAILLIISIVGYVLLIISTKTTYLSTYGYFSIIMVAFFFALILPKNDNDDLLLYMLIATYSVIAVAILMLVIILGGDGIDFDFDLGLGSSDKKKHKELQ